MRTATRFVLAVTLVAGAACTYDYTLGRSPGPRDAGALGDAGDAGGAAGDAAAEAGGPTGVDDAAAVSCIDETVQLKKARAAAIACSGTVECKGRLADECGCAVPVVSDIADASIEYLRVVARYRATDCGAPCAACQDSGLPAACDFDPANMAAGFVMCAIPPI